MEAAFVSTKTGESRASHAKMDKTQTEVVELDRIKTKGEFYGCKISYTVVKNVRRHQLSLHYWLPLKRMIWSY